MQFERTRHVLSAATAGGFIAGLALAVVTSAANADYRKVSATICQPAESYSIHDYLVYDAEVAAENASTTSSISFVCPIVDNSDLPLTGLTTVSALVSDGRNGPTSTSSVQVKLCAWNTNVANLGVAPAAYCGFPSSTLPTYTGTMTLPVADKGALDGYGNTGYLHVTLPRNDADSIRSKVRLLVFEN